MAHKNKGEFGFHPGVELHYDDTPRTYNHREYAATTLQMRDGVICRHITIVSRHSGGSVRSYFVSSNKLYLQTPAYPEKWDELDKAVSESVALDFAK